MIPCRLQGVSRNSIDPGQCCDTMHGPRGFEECWDDYFTYELCCLGDPWPPVASKSQPELFRLQVHRH